MQRNNTSSSVDRREFVLACLASGGASAMLPSPSLGQESSTLVNHDLTEAMKNAKLSMLFQGHTNAECQQWQREFRAKLAELLGNSTPPSTWTIIEESRSEFEKYTRLELLLNGDGIPALPVYLLVPKGLPEGKNTPAVLCVHGHGPYGNDPIVGRRDLDGVAEQIAKANYDYGVKFAERGYVVAAPCMTPFGRRVDSSRYGGKDPCAVTFVRMQALGRLPITANLRDLRWAIDLLQSRPEVKDNAIGCAGLSYGGRMTMMVSAIDQRVKVASVSGALNLLQERMMLRHSCGSQVIPGLLQYGDYSEIGSLIAPRPCVWETGSNDGLIVPKWDDLFRQRLRNVYQALGVAGNLHFDRFEGGHQWSGKIAYPLFDKVLKS